MFEKIAEKLREKAGGDPIVFRDYPKTETVVPDPEPIPEEPSPVAGVTSDAESAIELKVVRPETFTDVSTIADHLIGGCTVVLNLELMERPETLRMLDFLNGVTYTTGGEIRQVAQTTFIITPHNVDVSDEK